jgi:hypothetical protein
VKCRTSQQEELVDVLEKLGLAAGAVEFPRHRKSSLLDLRAIHGEIG